MSAPATSANLPAAPRALLQVLEDHPRGTDVLVAVCAPLPSLQVVLWVHTRPTATQPAWVFALSLVLLALVSLALLGRRRAPARTLVAVVAATVALAVVQGQSVVDPVPACFALYAVAVHASVRAAWTGWAATVAVTTAAVLVNLAAVSPTASRFADLLAAAWVVAVLSTLLTLVATLWGARVGDRRRYVDALVARAEQLVRERDQQGRLAAAAERARITRDVHDVVSHSLSVMVSLSDGAAAVARRDPDEARRAMGEVGDVGRGSLAEMGRLLGVLRGHRDAGEAPGLFGVPGGPVVPGGPGGAGGPIGPGGADAGRADAVDAEGDAPLQPLPTVAQVPALVAAFAAAGLPVRLDVRGEPPADAGAQSAVYRIVQEALTNALRYAADPVDVRVGLSFDRAGATAVVQDDGAARDAPPVSVGGGGGLVGVRERVAMFGGTLEAGPGEHGGWTVRATLPGAGGPR